MPPSEKKVGATASSAAIGPFQGKLEDLQALPEKEKLELIQALQGINILERTHIRIELRKKHRPGLNGVRIISPKGQDGIKITLQGDSSDFFECVLFINRVTSYAHYSTRLLEYLEDPDLESAERPEENPIRIPSRKPGTRRRPYSPPQSSVTVNRVRKLRGKLASQAVIKTRHSKTQQRIHDEKQLIAKLERDLAMYASQLESDSALEEIRKELAGLESSLDAHKRPKKNK